MKVSKLYIIAIILLLSNFAYGINTINAQTSKVGINCVVIDAGHGGPDAGAVNKAKYEKDVNLSVALRLGSLIKEYYPDVKVIYTRTTDVLIPLYERSAIANRAGADLFISIHVNSAKAQSANGTETLVMGMDKAGKNLDIAMKENDVITFESDYKEKYEGYKPGDAESFVMFSLMQYAYQGGSITFADMVQKQFVKNTTMVNRGVKQSPVLVLWNTAMPSILAEFGFLSNAKESNYIYSDKGRETYARCLFNAFSEYKTKEDKKGKLIILDSDVPVMSNFSEHSAKEIEPVETLKGSDTKRDLIFRVQIMSGNKLPKNSNLFGKYRSQVEERVFGKVYKYYVGCVTSMQEALSLQAEVRKTVKGAFLVPFLDDKPISMDDARKISK